MCLCHKIVPGRQMISPDKQRVKNLDIFFFIFIKFGYIFNSEKCCLNTPYNSGLRECCGGKLIDLEGPHNCCFGVPYDQDRVTIIF